MPAVPPVAFATLASNLPSKPYILGITPTSLSGHLVLQHGTPELTLADNQSLQSVETLRGGHSGTITSVQCEAGTIWSSAKDATVVRWDERTRRPATTIKAFIRKPLPVTALAVSDNDHLVIAGTELVSSEAHILFWDTRNPNEPTYRHSSTHSDDITHLSILPPTSSFQTAHPDRPLPKRLLLSTATDGCIALSDLHETDEEEAVQAEENWNQSVAAAGTFMHKGKLKVWARSDMDNLASWNVGKSDEGELQLEDLQEANSDQFKFRNFDTPSQGPSVVHAPMEEKPYPSRLTSSYLIDVLPSLGVGKNGDPMVGVGTNDGNIILQHPNPSPAARGKYEPSAYFVSGPGARGHKDVVRCAYHTVRDDALYTGSEDGVLAGWSLASLPRLITGDPDVDDDGGDGREDIDSEDEESEIQTESSSSSSEESDRSDRDMEVDGDEEEERRQPGPILGGGRRGDERKGRRRDKRPGPY